MTIAVDLGRKATKQTKTMNRVVLHETMLTNQGMDGMGLWPSRYCDENNIKICSLNRGLTLSFA